MSNYVIKVISSVFVVFALAVLLGFLELVIPPLSVVLATLFEIIMGVVCAGAIIFMVHTYKQNAKK